jgi:hypothetical protein
LGTSVQGGPRLDVVGISSGLNSCKELPGMPACFVPDYWCPNTPSTSDATMNPMTKSQTAGNENLLRNTTAEQLNVAPNLKLE